MQVVHYPLFAAVGLDAFVRYEALHTSRISLIVMPLMIAELAGAAALALSPEPLPFAGRTERVVGLGLVLAIWASTFLLSVPEHGRLAGGFDADAQPRHARFDRRRNWWRR